MPAITPKPNRPHQNVSGNMRGTQWVKGLVTDKSYDNVEDFISYIKKYFVIKDKINVNAFNPTLKDPKAKRNEGFLSRFRIKKSDPNNKFKVSIPIIKCDQFIEDNYNRLESYEALYFTDQTDCAE